MIKHDAAPIRSALALVLISPFIAAGVVWLVLVAAVLFSQEKIGNAIRRHRIKQLCRGAK